MKNLDLGDEPDHPNYIAHFTNLVRLSREPVYFNYLAAGLERHIVRLQLEINAAPPNEREKMQENLILLYQLVEDFCDNHPLTLLKGKDAIKQELFNINIPGCESLNPIFKPCGWLKSLDSLIAFYSLLKSAARIRCYKLTYVSRFIGNFRCGNKIWYYGSLSELVYLISRLIDESLIPNHKEGYLQLTAINFCDGDGKPLNISSMYALKTRGPGRLSELFIDNTIDKLKQIS